MVICYPLGSGYGMKPVPVTVIGDGDEKKFVSWGWLWYSNNRWLVSRCHMEPRQGSAARSPSYLEHLMRMCIV